MKKRCMILAVALGLAAAATGRAYDTVKTTSGTVVGDVKTVGPFEVVLSRSGVPQKIPVNEIVMIYYEGEPSMMKAARSHLIEGRYRDAREALSKVNADDLDRPEIKQDLDFYQALCAARLALGGGGTTIRDAGSQMTEFARQNAKSYHVLEAYEMIGDLAVASGLYAHAEKSYARIATAPWPDYQMRANVAIGRARLAQGKTAEARQAFQSVLDATATGELASSQKMAATIGLARCMDDPAQAIQSVESILAKADPEDVELHARAYNTLGTAHRKAGRTKQALLAFLHVDVLYFAVPEAHAEALANLSELWLEIHQTERSVRARRILEERYANSRWAKQQG